MIARQAPLPRTLEDFNKSLLGSLSQEYPDTRFAQRMRDTLIDYAHGFLLAQQHSNAGSARQTLTDFEASVALILAGGKVIQKRGARSKAG